MNIISEEEFDKLDLKGKREALSRLLDEMPQEKIPVLYEAVKEYCDEEGISIEE